MPDLCESAVSLQILNNLSVTYAADLWSLGCVTYQMLVGATPFKAATEYLTFQRISAGQVDIPAFVPAPAQDLLRKLLVPDAGRRLGQLICCLHCSRLPCMFSLLKVVSLQFAHQAC